jgi:hypothetical protein
MQPKSRLMGRTSTVKKSLAPKWNEKFKLDSQSRDKEIIVVSVRFNGIVHNFVLFPSDWNTFLASNGGGVMSKKVCELKQS